MYNGLLTACDSCAKPLEGRVGTANINLPHLIVKGNIGARAYDKEKYPDGYLFWAKRAGDISQLHYCNEVCLGNYLSSKIFLITSNWEHREGRKKEEFQW